MPTSPPWATTLYLLSGPYAQATLALSLLLFYGEVKHTRFYEKMTHRAHIASLLRYLWHSTEHRGAFQKNTDNKSSFIKFANGLMSEIDSLITLVMEKTPPDMRRAAANGLTAVSSRAQGRAGAHHQLTRQQ